MSQDKHHKQDYVYIGMVFFTMFFETNLERL